MPYVSELLGTPVLFDSARLGRVRDVLAAGEAPLVSAVLVDGGRRLGWGSLRWQRRVALVMPEEGDERPSDEVSLGGLLDSQIFDARNMKVARVNDVRLEWTSGDDARRLRVDGVDVGARGFLRRLGLERLGARVADLLGYSLPEVVIPWSYVASLEAASGVRLGVDRALLAKLRPVEVAEILDALGADERLRLLHVMDDSTLANALYEASSYVQEETLDQIGDPRAGRVLDIMPPDEAADVLGGLAPEGAQRLMARMGERERDVLGDLMGYHPRTAGGLMTPEFVAVRKRTRVGEAIDILRREAPEAESIYYVYAVGDRGELKGVVALRDLLTTPPEAEVDTIVRSGVVRVNTDDSDEEVAETMERYDLLALPVVERDDVLVGIITVDDVMRTLETRASDDLAAVTGAADVSRPAALAPGRLGALIGSLAAGLIAAFILLYTGWRAGAWVVAAAIPLLLRLAQDQGAWALAAHLEDEPRAGIRRTAIHVGASAVAVLPPALVFGAGSAFVAGTRTGFRLGAAVVASSAVAAAVGVLLPAGLAAAGRESALRHGRLVPLVSSLGGLLVLLALAGTFR